MTGIDIVASQIQIAEGKSLDELQLVQKDIEVRLTTFLTSFDSIAVDFVRQEDVPFSVVLLLKIPQTTSNPILDVSQLGDQEREWAFVSMPGLDTLVWSSLLTTTRFSVKLREEEGTTHKSFTS